MTEAELRAVFDATEPRHDAGERLPAIESWRLAENRWAALRDRLDAELADLEIGERRPLRELVPVITIGPTSRADSPNATSIPC
jgi:gamma-glutamyl:cysteine ligase YbdK (ATP-grasp superfamily)